MNPTDGRLDTGPPDGAVDPVEPPPTAEPAGGVGSGETAAARAQRIDRWTEVVAVVLLGLGTLLAAWSGYQANLWNGIQASNYARGSGERVESTKASTLAGQQQIYDTQTFSQWLDAHDAGNSRLMATYERRFRGEFHVAYTAWLATDPFNDPKAPAGPLLMPQYVQASTEAATQHEQAAEAYIAAGEDANDVSDRYVLATVIFATLLFLAAMADRFDWLVIEGAILVMGTALALFGAAWLLRLPIA